MHTFTRDLSDVAMSGSEFVTPKAQRQRVEYMQDVGNSLFNKYKKELHDEAVIQYEFAMHGQGAPDREPPSGFIIFSRMKLMCNKFIELHLCDSNDEVCKEWISMTTDEKKPFVDCNKQLLNSWKEL